MQQRLLRSRDLIPPVSVVGTDGSHHNPCQPGVKTAPNPPADSAAPAPAPDPPARIPSLQLPLRIRGPLHPPLAHPLWIPPLQLLLRIP